MLKRLGLSVLFGVALASAASAQGVSQYDGQYAGAMTLSGIVSGDCTTPPLGSAYPLTISGGVVRFKYVPRFDTVLVGKIDANGSFKAAANTKSGTISMAGHFVGYGHLVAKIQSPSCLYGYEATN